MSNRFWMPGRLIWVVGSALAGLFTALWLLHPTDVTRAQDGAMPAAVDPRWLAMLSAERTPLEGTADAEGTAAAALTVNALVQDGSVAGFAPSGVPVQITIERGGLPIATNTVAPVLIDVGWLYSWSTYWSGAYIGQGFSGGDVIRVVQGNLSRTLTVADFRAVAYPATDHLKGVAAPVSSFYIQGTSALDPTDEYTTTASSDVAGEFDVDLSSIADVMAGDTGFLRQTLDPYRSIAARFVAPRIQAQVGNNVVGGRVAPYQVLTMKVIAGGTIVASRSMAGDYAGQFEMCMVTCSGPNASFAVLLPGRQVELTAGDQVLTMTIPVLSARAALVQQQVAGSATPGAVVSLLRWPGPIGAIAGGPIGAIEFDSHTVVTASAEGVFTASLPFEPADYGAAVVHDGVGHLAYARYAVSNVHVVIDRRDQVAGLLSGQIDRMSEAVTLTVLGPSGFPKAEVAASTSALGRLEMGLVYPWFQQADLLLTDGDTISVTNPDGLSIVIPIEGISVTADVLAQRISGQGPSSTRLPIKLYGVDPYPAFPNGYETSVLTDLAGFFGLDLVGVRIKSYSRGTINWTNSDGHTIEQAFTATPTCLPDVQSVLVDGNTLTYVPNFDGSGQCAYTTTLSLSSSQGVVKHTLLLPIYGATSTAELTGVDGDPIRIEPGDTLTILNGTQELTLPVPLLSVAADVSLQRVTGRAPAGSTVHLVTYNAFGPQSPVGPTPQWIQDVVADLQGDYYWDIPVNPGDYVQASIVSRSGVSFETMAVVPAIELYLYQTAFAEALPPLTPYTITLQSSHPTTPTVVAGVTTDRGGIRGNPPYTPGDLPWFVQPGDRVIVEAGSYARDWTLPRFTASIDVLQAAVYGEAPANHTLTIRSYYDASSVSGQSDGTGHYRIPLPAGVYPGTGLYVTLHTAQGDRLTLMAGVSNWKVDINSPCVEFSTSRLVSSGVVTLADSQGHLRATQNLMGYYQSMWQVCFSGGANLITVRPGDRLSLTVDGEVWSSYTVPTLTLVHDPGRGVVIGSAPAEGFASLSLSRFESAYTLGGRSVSVGPTGTFGIDISDLPWQPRQTVYLRYGDGAGNWAQQPFVLTGYQHWLPIIGHP